jgi:tetratricopeptide (TPR) repeat protein
MSRFNNLELGSTPREEPRHEAVKDEAYFVAEGLDLYHKGRYDEALRAYSRVLEHNPANTHAWCAQVRMLVELGELREARLWVDKALERFPNDAELLAAKAVVLARMGEHDSALAFSDASVEERGDTPYVWLARGEVLLAREDSGAPYCFERALALRPRDWSLRWLAARIHAFYRRFALALAHARQAVELAPERAVAWIETGHCELALGLAGRARESFAQARQLDPSLPGLDAAATAVNGATFGGGLMRRVRALFS